MGSSRALQEEISTRSSSVSILVSSQKNLCCIIKEKTRPWLRRDLISVVRRNKRVCVDLSCWMVEMHKVNQSYCATKEKVYLRGFFHRLRALIALNCSIILVSGIYLFTKLPSISTKLGFFLGKVCSVVIKSVLSCQCFALKNWFFFVYVSCNWL